VNGRLLLGGSNFKPLDLMIPILDVFEKRRGKEDVLP
jgi:hypothetical protein